MSPVRARRPIDWDTYLEDFHTSHPGITEDVLARCTNDNLTPYQWLLAGVDATAQIVDIGCGSAPAKPKNAARWVGIDRSMTELRRAQQLGRTTILCGDATCLPIADRSVDIVTCSMALMLVHPPDLALREIHRILHPNGELRLLLPARTPLTATDRLRYLQLFWAARSPTKFPATPLRSQAAPTLQTFSLGVEADDTRRFLYPIADTTDADRLIDSWYLPNVEPRRRQAARARARHMAPTSLGIPLRRIVAKPI